MFSRHIYAFGRPHLSCDHSSIPAFALLVLVGIFFPAHAYGASDVMLAVAGGLNRFSWLISIFMLVSSFVAFVNGSVRFAFIGYVYSINFLIFGETFADVIFKTFGNSSGLDSTVEGSLSNFIFWCISFGLIPLLIVGLAESGNRDDNVASDSESIPVAETGSEGDVIDLDDDVETHSTSLPRAQVKRKIVKD